MTRNEASSHSPLAHSEQPELSDFGQPGQPAQIGQPGQQPQADAVLHRAQGTEVERVQGLIVPDAQTDQRGEMRKGNRRHQRIASKREVSNRRQPGHPVDVLEQRVSIDDQVLDVFQPGQGIEVQQRLVVQDPKLRPDEAEPLEPGQIGQRRVVDDP